MNQRPLSVTVIAWVFIATGVGGLALHLGDLKSLDLDNVLASLVRAIAVVCGLYMLRGADWARWLSLVWMAFHVVLSSFHSLPETAVHSLLLAVIAYFLLRPPAREFFRRGTT